ncbi:hypothetical protein GCM10009557_93760 [Virgisporangium ochraceum]|jgi:hypothetical protein|uniref:Uncharacterized protein n=1 Tax=Virgisporangium ochraceum TaxID=65505 RepID=A0A8J3ZYI5_9ACTN|nr:hypothetical protein [Virgisporangium ochraceum]GIJ70583.1 hypothetical protein Voc01_055000 [Virgisporangium ochraceum]
MKKLTRAVIKLVLPEATAKAAPISYRCVNGCGYDGVLIAGRTVDGKRPCC